MDIDWTLHLIVFISTLIATLIGIYLAFYLNGLNHKKLERIRARRLLVLLKDEIKENWDLLKELEKELKIKDFVPFYPLRFDVWNGVTSNLILFLEKRNMINNISQFYFEIKHIERKLNGILNFTPLREEFANSLRDHIPLVLKGERGKSPQTIISEIECLIKRL